MPITSTINQPNFYTHAYSPIVFSCLSDAIDQLDMKYIFDVYVNDSKVATIKQLPNPSGIGVIDVSSVVQGYIDVSDSVDHEVEAAMGTSVPFKNLTTEYAQVYVKVGEEYRAAPASSGAQSPLLQYDGIGSTAGLSPAYPIYSRYYTSECWVYAVQEAGGATLSFGWVDCQGATHVDEIISGLITVQSCTTPERISGSMIYTIGVTAAPGSTCGHVTYTDIGSIVLPAAANVNQAWYHESIGASGATAVFGSFTDYTMPNIATGAVGKFLTQAGSTHSLFIDDQATLTFINMNGKYSAGTGLTYSSYDRFPFAAKVTNYDSTGATISTSYYNNNETNGGGIGFTACSGWEPGTTVSADEATVGYNLMSFITSPSALGFTSSTSYYTVELVGGTGCTGGTAVSETIRYELLDDCDLAGYPSIRISWLNRLGGRDYFNFTMYYELSTNQKTDSYFKDANDWSSSSWSMTPWKSGSTVYNKELTRTIRVTTDWLSEGQVSFLKTLFESPSIHVWLPDNSQYPEPCTVTSPLITEKSQSKEKLVTLTFEIQLSITDRTQNN